MARRVNMQIAVPAKIKAWVEGQVDSGLFRDAGHFFEQAAKQALTAAHPGQVEARLLEAINGAPAKPLRRAELQQIEQRLRRRHALPRPARKIA